MTARKLTTAQMTSPTPASAVLAGITSKEELAAALNVSPRTIENFERRGLIVPLKIGRRKYYDIEKSNRRLRGERDPAPRRLRRRETEETSAQG